MTEEHAILEADFATWRPVQGRKVLQLVFEVPLEKTQEVLAKLGTPLPGQSIWVAIAKLDLQAQRGAQAAQPNSTADKPAPSPGAVEQTPVDSSTESAGVRGRKWSDIPYSQQAAIRCQDPDFWKYLSVRAETARRGVVVTEDYATEYVRGACGIESRSELDDPEKEFQRECWKLFEEEYQSWRADRQFRQSKHG